MSFVCIARQGCHAAAFLFPLRKRKKITDHANREGNGPQHMKVLAALWGAVASAFKLACDKGDDVTVSDFDDVFKSKDAFAFASVRTAPLQLGTPR